MSGSVRPDPSLSDNDGQSNSGADEIWLTTDQIVQRLSDKFDVKRDRRSAERYCNSGKVRAFLDDAQGIWFAEQSSVGINCLLVSWFLLCVVLGDSRFGVTMRLLKLSNYACLPSRAGGSPFCARDITLQVSTILEKSRPAPGVSWVRRLTS